MEHSPYTPARMHFPETQCLAVRLVRKASDVAFDREYVAQNRFAGYFCQHTRACLAMQVELDRVARLAVDESIRRGWPTERR